MPTLIRLNIVAFTPAILNFQDGPICNGVIDIRVQLIPVNTSVDRFQLILDILPVSYRFLFSNNKPSITGIYKQVRNGDIIRKEVAIRLLNNNSGDQPPLIIRAGGVDMLSPATPINTHTQQWPYII